MKRSLRRRLDYPRMLPPLRILFAGDFDPDYNRTRILRAGLRALGHDLEDCKFNRPSSVELGRLRSAATRCDAVFLPSFSHNTAPSVRACLPHMPMVFDPLISLHMTRVTDYKRAPRWSLGALRSWIRDRRALRAADTLIFDTEAHRQWFASAHRLSLERSVVVPVGNDFTEFYPAAKANPTHGPLRVGFYGGFIPLQGVLTILRAAAQLQEEHNVDFELIGDGYEGTAAKRLITEMRIKNVRMRGWLPYEHLCSAIQSFDIALGIFGTTPKSSLVVPNKVFHYMGCGIPVITRDSIAIRELFRHNSELWLVEPDPKSLASAILRLAKDAPLRSRIGKAGHDSVASHYSSRHVASELERALRLAIETHTARSLRHETLIQH